MEVLAELWWVSVLIGGPALIAVLWERRAQKRKEAQLLSFKMRLTPDESEHTRLMEEEFQKMQSRRYLANKRAQKHKDDMNFAYVEEYRNELDGDRTEG